MVTLKEVAKRANVSTTTVSYVLNGCDHQVSRETKEKVLEIVKELNYKPNKIAKSLRTNKTNTIGIIVEDITVFNTPDIINGIGDYAEKHGYNIILNNLRVYKRLGNNYSDVVKCKKNISSLIETILSRETDGIIYIGAHYRDVTGIMDSSVKPIVYTYCYAGGDSSNWVNFNDEAAAYEVTEYLIGFGHKRIAVITGMVDSIPCQERLKGYQKAIIDNNLLINPAYVKVGDWQYQSGYTAAKELLSDSLPPTAIFAMNDLIAGGVIDAARDMDVKIPEDLSLIGFDNRECSFYYVPKLTTVEIPLNEMGRLSAQFLVDIIENNKSGNLNAKLKCKLIKRESVSRISEKFGI